MDRQSDKSLSWKFLLTGVIILAAVLALFLWKVYIPKPSGPAGKPVKPKAEPPAKSVLHSPLAGKWYPADARILSEQIASFFQKAQTQPINDVIALVLPHAGYQFSGQTAAEAIKAINREYKRVVIIGPTHGLPMQDVLSLPRVTHYQTPLGQIPLDTDFITKLLEYPLFQNIPAAHKYEHSVQIELPLLQQYSRADFKLVPIVAGQCSLEQINKAASILKSLVDDQTLVIASSDFVHYGPNYGYTPFEKDVPAQIEKLNLDAYEFIKALDCEGFLQYRRTTGATICGYVPIAILLSMLSDADKTIPPIQAHLISHTSSGELTGDYTNSVSYLSIAFSGHWGKQTKTKPPAKNPDLSDDDKKQLLSLARKSILYFLEKRQLPDASELGFTVTEAMKSPRAAFVTLKKDSQLRGCIGDIFPTQPLYKSVITNAVRAAVKDRRFPPVTQPECSDITIEISVLTVPEPVSSPEQIRIGTDGVIMEKAGRGAVFLPQVAPEQGWNVEQTLNRLSLKANLPADGWKQGAAFLVFQADVFGEEK